MNEFNEWSNAFRLAPRREHVMSEMVMKFVLPVVLPQEDLDGTPRGLDGICVVPGDRIDEVDAVIDSAVLVTQRIEVEVRTPAIADDGGAGFDPVTYNVNQCVSGSIRNGNKKCPAGFALNTAIHPLTLNRVPSMVISPSELALVNFGGLVRITDFFQSSPPRTPAWFPCRTSPSQ
jgi:hypothetical protein